MPSHPVKVTPSTTTTNQTDNHNQHHIHNAHTNANANNISHVNNNLIPHPLNPKDISTTRIQHDELQSMRAIYGDDWKDVEPGKTAWGTKEQNAGWWEVRLGVREGRVGCVLKGRMLKVSVGCLVGAEYCKLRF